MATHRIRVLIVDDIPATRENIGRLLYFEEDIEVVGSATSGPAGVQMARERKPDVILMEGDMPSGSGLAATSAIRTDLPGCRVILMSNLKEPEQRRQAVLAGAHDYLTRPITREQLSDSIRRVCKPAADGAAGATAPVRPAVRLVTAEPEGPVREAAPYSPAGSAPAPSPQPAALDQVAPPPQLPGYSQPVPPPQPRYSQPAPPYQPPATEVAAQPHTNGHGRMAPPLGPVEAEPRPAPGTYGPGQTATLYQPAEAEPFRPPTAGGSGWTRASIAEVEPAPVRVRPAPSDGLSRAGDQRQSPEPAVEPQGHGRVISIFGPKGGVGKTTVATNLAVALKLITNKSVVLADASLIFGDVGTMLNLRGHTVSDLIRSIDSLDRQLVESALVQHSSGIKVLLAPPRPELADLVTAQHLRTIVAFLKAMFDYVVIDTRPSFDDPTLAMLDISDRILVVTTLELPAITNLRRFLDVAEAIDYPEERLLLVANRANSTGGIRAEDVEQNVKVKISANIVSSGQLMVAAVNQGVPVVMSNRNSQIAKNLMSLAAQLLAEEDAGRVGTSKAEPARPGPVSRPGLRLGLGGLSLSALTPVTYKRREGY